MHKLHSHAFQAFAIAKQHLCKLPNKQFATKTQMSCTKQIRRKKQQKNMPQSNAKKIICKTHGSTAPAKNLQQKCRQAMRFSTALATKTANALLGLHKNTKKPTKMPSTICMQKHCSQKPQIIHIIAKLLAKKQNTCKKKKPKNKLSKKTGKACTKFAKPACKHLQNQKTKSPKAPSLPCKPEMQNIAICKKQICQKLQVAKHLQTTHVGKQQFKQENATKHICKLHLQKKGTCKFGIAKNSFARTHQTNFATTKTTAKDQKHKHCNTKHKKIASAKKMHQLAAKSMQTGNCKAHNKAKPAKIAASNTRNAHANNAKKRCNLSFAFAKLQTQKKNHFANIAHKIANLSKIKLHCICNICPTWQIAKTLQSQKFASCTKKQKQQKNNAVKQNAAIKGNKKCKN